MLDIREFHVSHNDASEADRDAQMLLQLGHKDLASVETTDLITNSLQRESIDTSQFDDILPPLHRLVSLEQEKLFPILQREAASGTVPKTDFIDRTLLHRAAERGDDRLLGEIIRLGKSYPNFKMAIEGRDGADRTALYLAVSHGHESAYCLLRRERASLKVRGRNSHSLLAMAARGNHVGIMKHLIDAGCEVNEKVLPVMRGCPPLPAAAEKGHLEAVQLLIERGADRCILKLPDQKTAAQLARDNGHHGVAAVIDPGG